MGSWAAGIFENDSALDFVYAVLTDVSKDVMPPEEVEDIDMMMGAVAVQMALVEHCFASPPKRETIQTVKASTLALYDAEIDALEPDPDYKVARRKVIEETFDRYLALLTAKAKALGK